MKLAMFRSSSTIRILYLLFDMVWFLQFQREAESGTALRLIFGMYIAAVGFDDGAAYRQSNAHAAAAAVRRGVAVQQAGKQKVQHQIDHRCNADKQERTLGVAHTSEHRCYHIVSGSKNQSPTAY